MARIGADDVAAFESPRPELLREISGIEPAAKGVHVPLKGARSTQRLSLGDIGGGVVVALSPAELKSQAEYLYRDGRAAAMIAAAREQGWTATPSPQLAFHNSPVAQRLYLDPGVSAEEYAQRWEGSDSSLVGAHAPEEVKEALWPWLKQRGYASEADDAVLTRFLGILGARPAHLRPGLSIRCEWAPEAIRTLGGRRKLAVLIRGNVNAILGAAGEPLLPAA
jgi:hypothetical protein